MKQKSALKQCVGSAKFLAVVLLIMIPVTIKWPNGYTLIILGILLFSFIGDVITVRYIKQKAAKDPAFLEEKIE